MKFRVMIGLLMVWIVPHTLQAQDTHMPEGVIQGSYYAYVLKAPESWVMEIKTGLDWNRYAVFHPLGSDWVSSSTVLYSKVADLTVPTHPNVESLIEYECDQFRSAKPDLKVVTAETVELENAVAYIRYIYGDKYGVYEAAAFIEEGDMCVLIGLSSTHRDEFNAALPAFHELVRSYRFMHQDDED